MKSGIMIDIETLGTAVDSVILSIGAVEFNTKGKMVKEFEVKIDIQDNLDVGRVINGDTVLWWMKQSDDARKELWTGERERLVDALSMLTGAFQWEKKAVWANGVTFDIGILEHAFRGFGAKAPWAYWEVSDYRTIKNLVPREIYKEAKENPVVAHSALADARAQATTLVRMLSWLEGK